MPSPSSRIPAIGLLADLLVLADLQVTRETLDDEWEALQQSRRGVHDDQEAELDEACADAEFEAAAVLGGLLERRAFARTLTAGLAQGQISPERGDQLLAEALEVASQATTTDPLNGQERDALMAALPVCGDGIERAYAADPTGFRQGLKHALADLLDEADLQMVLFPLPIHPLAWADLDADARYGLFLDLQMGQHGDATEHLLALHADVIDRASYPEDAATWSAVASPLRIWPVLLSRPLDLDQDRRLEDALIFLEDTRAWATWVRQVNLEPPALDQAPRADRSWVSAPMPILDALPITALDQIRHQQADLTTPVRLVDTDLHTDPEDRSWCTLAFEDADGWPHPATLPAAWLGGTQAQREATLERAFEAWNGVGPQGLDGVPVPEPVPEPPRPPRQRPTLRVVRP